MDKITLAMWLDKNLISYDEYVKLCKELGIHIKPPLGLIPKWLWKEQRVNDIKEAIKRFTEVNKPIPQEWIEEYNELLK